MLFISIITILTASALSSIHVSSHQLTRCGSLVLISTGVMAANTFNVSAMGPGISLYEGILQVTPMSQATDVFISLAASTIVGHVWTPESYIKTVKITTGSVQPAVAEFSIVVIVIALSAITISFSNRGIMTIFLGFMFYIICFITSYTRNSKTSISARVSNIFGTLGSVCIIWLGLTLFP